MRIAVLVKPVPDPSALRFDPRHGDLVPGVQLVVNEYDLYAVEAALRLREQVGGDVIVGTVGGGARDALSRCLAMGADRAVWIDGEGLPGDSLTTATVVAAWLRQEEPDVIWAGQETSDAGTGNVAPHVATLLGWPLVSNVVGWQYQDGQFTLEREIEDGHQFQTVAPPVVLCALSALDTPRLPTLRGIMEARRKPLEQRTLTTLGLDPAALSPRVQWGKLFEQERRASGIVLQDVDPDEAVERFIAFLRERRLLAW
ncbi:MAG: electron transfer flavoprotein subunit beta/FixA family protein [Thermorudis peleae]|nr:electron transfer flavoprotein subunit beta/FixA family protein [Thermorudis peleae]